MARWRPRAILALLFSVLLFSGCATTGVSPQDKKKASAAINLGEAYMGGGNYTAALGELLKAEKLNPDDPILHNDLGLVYMAKEKFDLAVVHFEKAVQLKPDYSLAKNNLGSAYLLAGEFDKGRRALEEALEDFTGSVLLVSHDRRFLDRTVGRSLEVADGAVRVFRGGQDDRGRARAVQAPQVVEQVRDLVGRGQDGAKKAARLERGVGLGQVGPGLAHVEQKRASGCRFQVAPELGRGKFAHRLDVRCLEIEFLGFTSVDQCRYRRFEQAFLVPFLIAHTGNQQRLHNGGCACNHKQPSTLIKQAVEAVVKHWQGTGHRDDIKTAV